MKEKDSKDFGLHIETGLNEVYATLAVGEPTKKIRKIFAKAAKKVTKEIKAHLKDVQKLEAKRKKADLKMLKKKQEKAKLKTKPAKKKSKSN